MDPHTRHQLGQGGFIKDRFRLRPPHPHGILHWAFEHHLNKQDDNEVQKKRGNNLINPKPGFQKRWTKHHQSAGQGPCDHDCWDENIGRTGYQTCSNSDSGKSARIELPFSPDIPELCTKRDSCGQSSENKRRCSRQHLGKREGRTKSPFDHQAIGFKNGQASKQHWNCGKDKRCNGGCY